MNFLRTLALAALIGAPLFADSIPVNTSGFGILAGAQFTTSGSLTVDGNIGTPTSGDYTQSGNVRVSRPVSLKFGGSASSRLSVSLTAGPLHQHMQRCVRRAKPP